VIVAALVVGFLGYTKTGARVLNTPRLTTACDGAGYG
jgi:hypothetical protein